MSRTTPPDIMQELNTKIKIPGAAEAIARDAASLKGLTSMINANAFSEDETGQDSGKFSPPPSETPNLAELQPKPQTVRTIVAPASEIQFESKIFTTGRLCAGKDTFLKSIGRTIHGFADPLYAIQRAFFGTDDKTVPGAREFLQKVGQWGRNTVSAQYPLTTERAVFITLIRAMGESLGLGVDWASYGKSDSIWCDALLARTEYLDNIGVSNVRFRNEREALTAVGFAHYHIMASPVTLKTRWAAAGIKPNDLVLVDVSEHLALSLDKAAYAAANKPGGKLRVIWSDSQVQSPSARFITL